MRSWGDGSKGANEVHAADGNPVGVRGDVDWRHGITKGMCGDLINGVNETLLSVSWV